MTAMEITNPSLETYICQNCATPRRAPKHNGESLVLSKENGTYIWTNGDYEKAIDPCCDMPFFDV